MKPDKNERLNSSKENHSYQKPSLAKETKKILQSNKIRLNKNLGQNYLIDDFKRKKIIEFGNLKPDDVVLEIGPGIGTLTLEIAKGVKKVIAIEQDLAISKILESRLKKESIENVEIINKDALKIDFPKFNKIISNLPYQISSPITFKLLEYDFDLAILMYQKEFTDRMIANEGDKNYSRLSAMLHFKTKVEFLDNVSPESFIPKPKVTSSIVRLNPLKNKNIENNEEYSIVCKALFQHKNKKIKNALIDSRHILGYDDKKEIRQILEESSDKNKDLESFFMQRTIVTSPEEILKIANYLKPVLKDGAYK